MSLVYRRPESATAKAAPSVAPTAKELAQKKHIAQLEATISRLKSDALALRTELEDQNRSDERVRKLEARAAKAHRYAQRAAASAKHWWAEAHRLGEGREIRHQDGFGCRVCFPGATPPEGVE